MTQKIIICLAEADMWQRGVWWKFVPHRTFSWPSQYLLINSASLSKRKFMGMYCSMKFVIHAHAYVDIMYAVN